MSQSRSPQLFAVSSSIVVLFAWAVSLGYYYHFRLLFPFDDTYITFRYAYNLAHGFGIVWNPGGAHTEGYTNFLFVLLLAPFSLITKELVPFAQWISIMCNLVTGFTLYRLAITLTTSVASRTSRFAGTVVVLLYFAEPYTWFNAFSGMETSMFVMFVVLTIGEIVRLLASRTVNDGFRTVFLLSFVTLLTRPEGGLLGMLALVVLLVGRPKRRREIICEWLAAFVVPLALYLAWKYWYFGDLLPNSFYVKVALRQTTTDAARGTALLPAYFLGIRYLLVLSAFAIIALRKRLLVLVTILGWIAALILLYANAALLQPFYFRFFYSIEVLLMLMAAIGLWYVIRGPLRMFGLPYILLAILMVYHIEHTWTKRGARQWTERDTRYDTTYQKLGELFHSDSDHANLTIAWSDAGILPYYSETKNIDLVGLNTTPIAHAHSVANVRSYLLREHPDFLFVPVDRQYSTDSTISVVKWGHGYIGAIYPTILTDSAFCDYRPVVRFNQDAYAILILCRRTTIAAHPQLIEKLKGFGLPVLSWH